MSLDPLEVLLSEKSSPEAQKTVLKNISQECAIDPEIRDNYVGRGLIDGLLGVCRKSGNLSVTIDSLTVLANVAHDSDTNKLLIMKKNGVIPILALLVARTHVADEDQRILRMQAHTQAAFVLRKLTYRNQECQRALEDNGGVKILVKMLGVLNKDSFHKDCCLLREPVTGRGKRLLEELTYEQNHVGKAQEIPQQEARDIVDDLCARGLIPKTSKTRQAGKVYSVKLYDSSDTDLYVTKEMIRSGYVWPDLCCDDVIKTEPEKSAEGDSSLRTDIKVTEVIDGVHFWAHIGAANVHKQMTEINRMLENQEQAVLDGPPQIGSLCCASVLIGGLLELLRVEVLELMPDKQVKVFAVDHGYTFETPLQSLQGMSPLCEVIRFQASLCSLHGVQTPPKQYGVLEHVIACLRNMCQEDSKHKLAIVMVNGVEALTKLSYVPRKEICKQTAACVLNLSLHFKIRARIGFLGGIKAMLDICSRFAEDDEVALLTTGAIRNLMLDSVINRQRAADLGALIVLTHVFKTTTSEAVKEQTLGAVNNLVGNAWALLDGENCLDLRGCVDEYRKPAPNKFSLAVVDDNIRKPILRKKRRKRALLPGEIESAPTQAALSKDDLESLESSSEFTDSDGRNMDCLTSGEDTDAESNGQRLLNKNLISKNLPSEESTNNTVFVLGDKLSLGEDELFEYRNQTNVFKFSSQMFARSACAFLNNGKGGTIYLGIRKDRMVAGLDIVRGERDMLRLGVDECLNNFFPPVKHDKYQVQFIPVVKIRHERKVVQDDRFVVEITFGKTHGTLYKTKEGKMYIRTKTGNEELTFQHIRERTIRDEEVLHNTQIKGLKSELQDLKRKLEEKNSPQTTITVSSSMLATIEKLSALQELEKAGLLADKLPVKYTEKEDKPQPRDIDSRDSERTAPVNTTIQDKQPEDRKGTLTSTSMQQAQTHTTPTGTTDIKSGSEDDGRCCIS